VAAPFCELGFNLVGQGRLQGPLLAAVQVSVERPFVDVIESLVQAPSWLEFQKRLDLRGQVQSRLEDVRIETCRDFLSFYYSLGLEMKAKIGSLWQCLRELAHSTRNGRRQIGPKLRLQCFFMEVHEGLAPSAGTRHRMVYFDQVG
jgi:hypothetical protein